MSVEHNNSPYSALFLWLIILALPVTALALWLFRLADLWNTDGDIMGLLAVSIGILGILIFFIFLHKYELNALPSRRARWFALGIHGGIIAVLFLFLIWYGFYSPWKDIELWGTYTLEEASKPWVISVLVIGVITILGNLFDLLGEKFFRRAK